MSNWTIRTHTPRTRVPSPAAATRPRGGTRTAPAGAPEPNNRARFYDQAPPNDRTRTGDPFRPDERLRPDDRLRPEERPRPNGQTRPHDQTGYRDPFTPINRPRAFTPARPPGPAQPPARPERSDSNAHAHSHSHSRARSEPRAGTRRAAGPPERTRDSVFFLLFGVVAVTAALGLIALAGYHFIQPILTVLDGN